MTESSSSTHDTPASLKEALHLAIDSLPTQSSSFGQISAGLVLEAINRLQFKGFSQDDQLAAILWTLPRKEALCLAPNYLIADIDAVSNLWEVFLIYLSYQTSSDQLSAATIGTAISKAPARARSILSVFLTVANEHCCRSMSTDIPNTVSKPYLQKLLAIARALEKNAVDTTADDLVASVENAIDKAHLTDDLTPERTWVWQIRALTNLSAKDAQPAFYLYEEKLTLDDGAEKRALGFFALSTASVMADPLRPAILLDRDPTGQTRTRLQALSRGCPRYEAHRGNRRYRLWLIDDLVMQAALRGEEVACVLPPAWPRVFSLIFPGEKPDFPLCPLTGLVFMAP